MYRALLFARVSTGDEKSFVLSASIAHNNSSVQRLNFIAFVIPSVCQSSDPILSRLRTSLSKILQNPRNELK